MYNRKALRRFFPGGINDPGSGVLKMPDVPDGAPGTKDSWGGTRAYMNPNLPSFANPGTSMKQMLGLDMESMKSFTNPDGTPVASPKLVGVKNKIKSSVDVDPEAGVNAFNTFARGAMNLFDPNKKTQCGPGTVWNSSSKMCEATNSMDLMAANNEKDRGDWTEEGMFREEGSDRNSRSTYGQYGGYMEDGGSSGFKVGQVVGMLPNELEQFLAAGGEVEYI
jgi:hypothetical protein